MKEDTLNKNFLRVFKRTDINRSKSCEHIPLKYINFMFKNFGYVPNNSFIRSKKFDPCVLGMDLDGDIITAESRNPFKSKYYYELAVNVEKNYFTVVRVTYNINNICYTRLNCKNPM